MCRLYGFRANEATKVECTLVHAQNALLLQSRIDSRGESHSDGWGISFYENELPEVERRDTAAHQDVHFSVTAERVYAQTVVAHVRAATIGAHALANTHPFVCGHWSFAHNGTLWGFDALRGRLEAETDPELLARRAGTTDSETIFYWLLTRLRDSGVVLARTVPVIDMLVGGLARAVERLEGMTQGTSAQRPPRLNLLLTDGRNMVASRWRNTLWWVYREGIHDCEICGIPHVEHDRERRYRAVVIASEPITQETWQEMTNGSVASVDEELKVRVRAVR